MTFHMNRKDLERPRSIASAPAESPDRESGGDVPAYIHEQLKFWPGREDRLAEQLSFYLDFLLRKNRQFNLTADRTPERQWAAHVSDALAVGRLIEQHRKRDLPAQRILDFGSGGGIPGLVWALLWPGAQVSLVESTGKKARFLTEAAGLLGLDHVNVYGRRAEDLAHEIAHREHYDLVTARAVAALPTLAEWGLPFVKQGGDLAVLKGPHPEGEIVAGNNAMETLGAGVPPTLMGYERADGLQCHLLIYRKVSATPSTYPRRGGAARRRPL